MTAQHPISGSSWKTDKNPADVASRGLYVQNLIKNSRWWNGPDFLGKPLNKQSILDGAEPMYILPEDPEIKKTSAMTTQSQERFSLPGCLRYFSSWQQKEQLQFPFASRKSTVTVRASRPQKKTYVPIKTQELRGRESIVKSVQGE